MPSPTAHTNATDPVIVTSGLRTASRSTLDLVLVAVHSDGTQEIIPGDQYHVVRSDDMHVWDVVALAAGYVGDDGTWCEAERMVRSYWTVTDAHGTESHYATPLEHR